MNKGTKEVPRVRSRLLGQEIAHGERRGDFVCSNPPVAAAQHLLSTCATRGVQGPGDHRVLLLDMKKA